MSNLDYPDHADAKMPAFTRAENMILFSIGTTLTVAALAGAGYSHYRYRVKNNAEYARQFQRHANQS